MQNWNEEKCEEFVYAFDWNLGEKKWRNYEHTQWKKNKIKIHGKDINLLFIYQCLLRFLCVILHLSDVPSSFFGVIWQQWMWWERRCYGIFITFILLNISNNISTYGPCQSCSFERRRKLCTCKLVMRLRKRGKVVMKKWS